MKTGLVLEGGALRTVFSSGVWDAFLDAELMPDYIVGVSAGAAYGVSYASRQKRRNLNILCHYATDPRYMGWRNFLDRENRSFFGMQFSYEEIPNRLIPFDYETFAAYPGEFEAVVTNLNTGGADYLPVPRRDDQFMLLRATCAMPVLFPIIYLGGQPCLDGGCADPIPWRHALEKGCDAVTVILTREREYVRRTEAANAAIYRLYRKYPKFVDVMRRRADAYNEDRLQLFRMEREGRAFVIAPDSTKGFSRTERDVAKIRALWQNGYMKGRAAAPALGEFWKNREKI